MNPDAPMNDDELTLGPCSDETEHICDYASDLLHHSPLGKLPVHAVGECDRCATWWVAWRRGNPVIR